MEKYWKIVIAAVAVILILAGVTYVGIGLYKRPEVIKQALRDRAEEDLYRVRNGDFDGTFYLFDPFHENVLDIHGKKMTKKDINGTEEPEMSLYQKKMNKLSDKAEMSVGDIVYHNGDGEFVSMTEADVTFIIRWYDMAPIVEEYNRDAYTLLLPYFLVESSKEVQYEVMDRYLSSLLEKVDPTEMNKDYEIQATYWLLLGGSNSITGEGARWVLKDSELIVNRMVNRLFEELDFNGGLDQDPPADIKQERDEIAANMADIISLVGEEKAREILEEKGYDGVLERLKEASTGVDG